MDQYLSKEQAYQFLGKAQERRQAARDAADEQAQIEAAADCGVGHFYMGDAGLAIRLFDEAQKLIAKTGARKDLLPTLIGMTGRAHQRQKRATAALDCYREAASTARQAGQAAEQLRWQAKEATTLIDMRQPDGLRKLQESVESGRALLSAGAAVAEELSGQLSSFASAIEETDRSRSKALWSEALELLKPLPPSRRHYFAADNYATTLHKWGLDHQALTYLEEALEVGRQIGVDPVELLRVAHRNAEALATLYGFAAAGDWLLSQRSLFPDYEWQIFHHAVVLYERGFFWAKMKAATDEWCTLKKIPTPIYKPLYEMTLLHSFACRGVGELDDTLAALEKAGEYAKRVGQPASQAVRVQTALVKLDRREFVDAVARASELWTEGVRDRLLARAFVEALIETGDFGRARQVQEEFKQHGGKRVDVVWMSARLADAGAGEPLKAWYEYGAVAHQEKARDSELEALNRLIALYAAGSEDRFNASRERLRIIDKARSNVKDLFTDSAWFSVTPKSVEFPSYLDAFLEEAIARDDGQNAVYELERFRSQMLVDLLAERRARWQHDQPDHLKGRSFVTNSYDRARYAYEGLLAGGADWRVRRRAAEELDRLQAMTAGAGGIVHVAAGWQGLHFPQSYQAFFDNLSLRQNEALLFQHVFGNRTVCWLIDATGRIQRHEIPTFTRAVLARMHGMLRKYHRSSFNRGTRDLAAPPHLQAGNALADLDNLLAQPLVEWLSTIPIERAFMIAGTSAAILPFHACQSVIEAGIELAVLPTSRALSFVRQPRTPPAELFHPVNLFEHPNDFAAARDRMVLVVDPTHSLRYAPLEAGVVHLTARKREVDMFDSNPVDIPRFTRATRVADVLHVIAHGTFDDNSPYRSGLYFHGQNKERLWTVADTFSELDAPAGRVAVLSGCETGLSKPNLISEEVSLPSALIAAGFAAVIATKWPVDDLSTALFMGEYHRRWYGGGTTICRALADSAAWLKGLDRAAAIASLRDLARRIGDDPHNPIGAVCDDVAAKAISDIENGPEPPFDSAYYWAPFFVVGDGAITADGVDTRVPAV